MGNLEKGLGLKMDREVFVEGFLGFCLFVRVRGWRLCGVGGIGRDGLGRRWCLEWF